MGQINAKIDRELLEKFRHIIFIRHGLRRGDFKNAIEEAIIDYIKKHSQA
jgi:hypothetical protein